MNLLVAKHGGEIQINAISASPGASWSLITR